MMDSVKCQFSLILSLTSTSLACLDTVCGVEVLSVILFSLLPRVCVIELQTNLCEEYAKFYNHARPL